MEITVLIIQVQEIVVLPIEEVLVRPLDQAIHLWDKVFAVQVLQAIAVE